MDKARKAGTQSARGSRFQRPSEETNCLKELWPDVAGNPKIHCLCPRCFPFSFAAVQAEILQRAFSRQVRDDGRDSHGS